MPFNEAETFFQNKLEIPTAKWTDLWHEQHGKGFMVAGAYKADLVSDFKGAVDKAIAQGTTLAEFRKDFDRIVATHGWSYKGGRNWRTEVIYTTNVRQAYNAGRWKQLTDPEQLKVMPYLRYMHNAHGISEVPRPLHVSWDGITLPANHPWWNTHYPMNGWGCKCGVFGATRSEYEAAKAAGKGEAPPSPIDPKTGEPVGIDKGFGFNVGKAQDRPYTILKPALDRYPEAVRRKFISEMAQAPPRQAAFDAFVNDYKVRDRVEGKIAEIGWFDNDVLDFLKERGREPYLPMMFMNDRQLRHLFRPAKSAAGKALSAEEARRIPSMIADREAVLYDTVNDNVLYVAASEEDVRKSKLVIEVNYALKKAGQVNLLITAGRVDKNNLREGRYIVISGEIK